MRLYETIRSGIRLAKKTIACMVKHFPFETRLDVVDVTERLNDGSLRFGDEIRVRGVFSEFLPLVDFAQLIRFPNHMKYRSFPKQPRSCRLNAIDDVFCGAFYPVANIEDPTSNMIPVLYKSDSLLQNYSSGEIINLSGSIVRLPGSWMKVLAQQKSNVFKRKDGMEVPFGIFVKKASSEGQVDKLKANAWILFHPVFDDVECERILYHDLHYSHRIVDKPADILEPFSGSFLVVQPPKEKPVGTLHEFVKGAVYDGVFKGFPIKQSCGWLLTTVPNVGCSVECIGVNILDHEQMSNVRSILSNNRFVARLVEQDLSEIMFIHKLGPIADTFSGFKIICDFQYDQVFPFTEQMMHFEGIANNVLRSGTSTCQRIYVDEVDSFERVRNVLAKDVKDLPVEVKEKEVKEFFANTIGENFVPKDWPGEKSDLYSSHVVLKGKRISTAFLLKGPSVRKLTIDKCGKRGNQILRLVREPAQLFVIQSNGQIDTDVVSMLEICVSELSRKSDCRLYYCIIDGTDTARLLEAYDIKA